MWLQPPTVWTASSATTKLEIWLSIASFVSDVDEHIETHAWQYWALMLQVNYAIYRPLQLKEINWEKKPPTTKIILGRDA